MSTTTTDIPTDQLLSRSALQRLTGWGDSEIRRSVDAGDLKVRRKKGREYYRWGEVQKLTKPAPKPEKDLEGYVHWKDAAALVGLTPSPIRRAAQKGQIRSKKGSDGKLYVHREDVTDTWKHGRRRAAGVQGSRRHQLRPECIRFESNGYIKQEEAARYVDMSVQAIYSGVREGLIRTRTEMARDDRGRPREQTLVNKEDVLTLWRNGPRKPGRPSTSDITLENGEYISTSAAASLAKRSIGTIQQRAKAGKIRSRKHLRNLFVHRGDILSTWPQSSAP